MTQIINDIIDHVIEHDQVLTNREVWDLVCKYNDMTVCKWMIEGQCVHVKQVTDVEKTNQAIGARNAEISMWTSGNPGPLAQARIGIIGNSPIPIIKKWQIDIVEGTHFSEWVIPFFKNKILEKRGVIEA